MIAPECEGGEGRGREAAEGLFSVDEWTDARLGHLVADMSGGGYCESSS